jgi:TonB family protein
MSNKKDISSLFDRSGNLTPDAMQRYVKGQLSGEELQTVEDHLESDLFDREAVEGLRKHPGVNFQDEINRLNEQIGRVAGEKAAASVPPAGQRYYWTVAAGLAGILAIAATLIFMFRSPVNEQLAFMPATTTLEIWEPIIHHPKSKLENRDSKRDYRSSNLDIQQSAISNQQSEIRNPEPGTRNPEPEIRNPEPGTRNPEPDTDEVISEMQSAMDVKEDAYELQEERIEPYLVVEQMPDFPGGEKALYNYLQEHIQFPSTARESGISGTVYVRFIVGKDGKISDVTLLRGIGGGCDEEAIRVVKEMPSWTPGKQNGTAVPVYFTLPVKFISN